MSASESMKHVATLGNSIIGVSVLAMPFCFKQCGILLGTLMLIGSALLTRFNCHLLLKGALLSRRKSYELFAFYCFGYYGKLIVETSIIGFLVGILVSFFVVIGDLGPQIISKSLDIDDLPSLRPFVLTALGIGVALPLGLLKNISSLGGISAISILFYIALVIKVFFEAVPVLATHDWLHKVTFWQPNGILQSLPIFALALSCQTQIFEISNALPDSSLGKMNKTIKLAVYLCTFIYICVGFFGYVAFCNQDFAGNVLVVMPSTAMTQLIKLGFVLSVVLSFPLVIFPCRASLYSLFNRKVHTALDSGVSAFIPESPFRMITIGLVVSTLILGILCPNIELVLGIVGSTIGTIICTIFPALMFIRITNRNTFERSGAQIVFCVGVFLLVASTFVTINNSSLQPSTPAPLKMEIHDGLDKKYENIQIEKKIIAPTEKAKVKPAIIEPQVVKQITITKAQTLAEINREEQRRQEPPIPQEEQRRQEPPIPQEEQQQPEPLVPHEKKVIDDENNQQPSISEQKNKENAKMEKIKEAEIPNSVDDQSRQEPPIPLEPENNSKEMKEADIKVDQQQIKVSVVDGQMKDDKVIVEKPNQVAVQQVEILKKLAEQQKESQQILQEQKQLLEALKAHNELHQPEEKVEQKQSEKRKNSTNEIAPTEKKKVKVDEKKVVKTKNITVRVDANTIASQVKVEKEKRVDDEKLEKKNIEDIVPVKKEEVKVPEVAHIPSVRKSET